MNHCALGPKRCAQCKNQRYGPEHQRRRKLWTPLVAGGTVVCARCGEVIAPGQAWDLDHLASADSRPSHARCNRVATTQRGRRLERGSAL